MAVPGMLPLRQEIDPATGLPIDPMAPPPLPGAPPPAPAMLPDPTMNQVAPGTDPGSGGRAVLAPILGMPQEQSKTVQGSEQKVAGKETRAHLDKMQQAGADLEAARGAKAGTDAAQELANRQADQNEAVGQLEAERARSKELAQAQSQRLEQERQAQVRIAEAQAQVDRDYAAAGRSYWADKPMAAGILAAIAVAASRRNSRIMGEDPGKSGVAAILDGAIDRDHKQRTAAYLKSKQYLEDAQKLPGKAKEAYDNFVAQLDQKTAQELRLLAKEAEVLKKSQKADPEAVAAEQDVLLAEAQKRDAEAMVKTLQPYDRDSKFTRVDVDGQAGAGKPASEATRDVVTGSEMFDKLAARQREIIQQNDGKIPLRGELAQEFETNDKRMATIQQKPLGKSDADAAAARKLQASPGPLEYGRQALGSDQPVKNYLKSLDVNSKALRDQAASMARSEGKLNPAAGGGAKADPVASASIQRLERALEKAKAAKDAKGVADLTREIRERKKAAR